MSYLFTLFPYLPVSIVDTVVYVVAGLGAILLTYSVFLEAERRQDAVLTIGALCLLVYSVYIQNLIFFIAMLGVALAAFVELVEILLGRHTHSDELVDKYKHPEA